MSSLCPALLLQHALGFLESGVYTPHKTAVAESVVAEARRQIGTPCMSGPVELVAQFTLPIPKAGRDTNKMPRARVCCCLSPDQITTTSRSYAVMLSTGLPGMMIVRLYGQLSKTLRR